MTILTCRLCLSFFFNDSPTTDIYTLSLHDALPICKSYLAQCISTEAGVPFGYMSAPSIQGMFMGMDVMRVWGLYNKARKLARKYGACILFIDEIDAIGKSRSGMGGMMGMGARGGMMGGGGA